MKPSILVAILVMFAGPGFAQSISPNKKLLKRFYQKVYKEWDMSVAEEMLAPGFVSHDWPKDLKGPEGFKKYYNTFKKAIPDAKYEVKDLITEGNRVVVRWEMHGHYENPFPGMDIQPTGQKIILKGVAIYRVEDKKLKERWVISDVYGLLKEVKQAAIHN